MGHSLAIHFAQRGAVMYSSLNTRNNKYVAKIFATNSAPVVQAGGQFELTHVWYTKQQFTGQM